MRCSFSVFAAFVLTASAASAQSVLERVLGRIDGASNLAQVNGTFANIAENVGGVTLVAADAANVAGSFPGYLVETVTVTETVEPGLSSLENSDVIFIVDRNSGTAPPVTITANMLGTVVPLTNAFGTQISSIQIDRDGKVTIVDTDGINTDTWFLADGTGTAVVSGSLAEGTAANLIDFSQYRVYSLKLSPTATWFRVFEKIVRVSTLRGSHYGSMSRPRRIYRRCRTVPDLHYHVLRPLRNVKTSHCRLQRKFK